MSRAPSFPLDRPRRLAGCVEDGRGAIGNDCLLFAALSGNERIHQADPQPSEIRDIAGRQSEVVDQRNRSDLLLERMVGIGDPETAPDLSGDRVEGQDALAELLDHAFPAQPFSSCQIGQATPSSARRQSSP